MESYIVTGAAGFIGSNIVKALNKRGINNIIAVDDLTEGDKFRNLVDCDIATYYDKDEFRQLVCSHALDNSNIRAIFHQGACSDTMNHDGRYMMENNYAYTVDLFNFSQSVKAQFLYASSAAVYGGSDYFKEERSTEKPLNVYGYSKFLFDHYLEHIRQQKKLSVQAVGLRYFNVYGPGEAHKGGMASVVYHHFCQFLKEGYVTLFGEYDGYSAGDQMRDFISVEDIVTINLYFLDHPEIRGTFNAGTGKARSFNALAAATVNVILGAKKTDAKAESVENLVEKGLIRYRDFPEALKGKYQSFTQADLTKLRATGYSQEFLSLETGVERYVTSLLHSTGHKG